jgi:hypothetical protein
MSADFEYNYQTDHPIAVDIREGNVWVTLADGRIIANPLDWHPWLTQATPEQLANVELDAFSVYWPQIDEGLDIQGMLLGIRPKTRESA